MTCTPGLCRNPIASAMPPRPTQTKSAPKRRLYAAALRKRAEEEAAKNLDSSRKTAEQQADQIRKAAEAQAGRIREDAVTTAEDQAAQIRNAARSSVLVGEIREIGADLERFQNEQQRSARRQFWLGALLGLPIGRTEACWPPCSAWAADFKYRRRL